MALQKASKIWMNGKWVGWDDAKIVASVEFSIAKKANTWLNPDNNFQAPPAPRSGAAARRRHNSTPF